MVDNGCGCGGTDCGSSDCGGSCPSSGGRPQNFLENTHELNSIKRVIGVVSGKGGVGKSLVTSTLSVMMRRKGYEVGVLDADITGPSIPKIFGINQKAQGSELGIYPQTSQNGIKVMSVNLMLDQDDAPVIWRGPIIAGVVKQFWTDVIWGEVDYLFLDMPPGTGDVPLTVFQSIPLDGIVIVTSPQDLVSMIVKKAYNMAREMNIPILGIVENMSYLKCPDCGKEINIFGKSKIDEIAAGLGLRVLGKMPIDPSIAELCDKGELEKVNHEHLADAVSYIENKLPVGKGNGIMKIAIATEGNNISSHFGKCEYFTVVEIENKSIKSKEVVSTEGNQHGLLPGFLASLGIKTVIAGGMGDGARQKLEENNIQIISGISGNIDEAIQLYIDGNLKSASSGCSGHEHSHEHNHGEGGCSCGNH
ncbi:ATPase involved in chromosome partitioning [Clostridium sp. BNL1100]|nr:ATPase involved in chromosome partitioning [Clostridium sp. BNL1100]